MRVLTLILCVGFVLSVAAPFSAAQDLPPYPPTLLEPAPGAPDVPTYIKFLWSTPVEAESYDLQVSLSPLFDVLEVDEKGITTNTFTPWKLFADGTTYFWRVRAVGPGGASRWEPEVGGQTFATLQNSIAPPKLLLPAENAEGVALAPTFLWSAVPGAEAYELQISASPLFDQPLASIPGIPDTALTLPQSLPGEGVYYWRVRSSGNSGTSVWSPIMGGRAFTIGSGLPASPFLLLPVKDAQGVGPLVKFVWSSVPEATTYELIITNDPLVNEIIADIAGIADTTITLPEPLDNSTTYYWRVRAFAGTTAGSWTPLLSGQPFTTRPSGLASPTLIAPPNGSQDLPTQPLFTWGAVPGATTYEILITSPQFLGGSEYMQRDIPATSFVPPPGALHQGVLYQWFVRARNASGNSAWAPGKEGWAFTTRLAPPARPVLNLPPNGATGLTRSTLLSWWNVTDSTATSFRVQVATDPDFLNPVVDDPAVMRTEVVVTLALSTKYYWRVLAANPEGESPWSDTWSFSTGDVAILPPVLVSPKEDATLVPVRPTFAWEPSPGATLYDLEVFNAAGLPGWLSEIAVQAYGIPGTTFKPAIPLRMSTVYAWHVRAINGPDTSLWSPMLTTRLFTTTPPAPPAPDLASPDNGSTDIGLHPALCWSPVPEARFYWVEIAIDPGFRSIVASYCGISEACITVLDKLSPNTDYYWRVSAKNDGGWGPHSSAYAFHTSAAGGEAPVLAEQPADETAQAGQTATFAILAKGSGPLLYQWQKGGADIPGATGISYTTGPVTTADDGALFRCVVSNAFGTATSSAARLTISTTAVNLVANSDFEAGENPWVLYTDGKADFSTADPGPSSAHAGTVRIATGSEEQQLYQTGIRLEPATYYRLRFNARADNGGYIFVSLLKHGCPYTLFGLDNETFAITSGWKSYSVEFPTAGFAGIVRDARLAFLFDWPHTSGDAYQIDDVILEKIFVKERSDTVVVNAGFENGLAPWAFYTSGHGSLSAHTPGDGTPQSAVVHITEPGDNTQLYQPDLMVIPDAVYQLTFKAYSSTGNDVEVIFHRNDAPYTNYGLYNKLFDLTTSWKTFSVKFVVSNITVPANNGRLRFWFPPYAQAGDDYFFDDIVLERIASSAVADGGSIIANPGFETGAAPWWFHTDGDGDFDVDAPGEGSAHAARIMITTAGTNVQLSQSNIVLKPLTAYRLSFKAYSSTGHDVGVSLQKHAAPYTNYGFERQWIDLSGEWQSFTFDFTTPQFPAPVGDGRLQIALGEYAQAGDFYYFDDVTLQQLPDGTGATEKTGSGDPGITAGIPTDFVVPRNYPNPFNPSTWITFGLPEVSEVSVKIYNVMGQEISNLFEGTAAAGYHRIEWKAQSHGQSLGSGVYFYRLIARGASGRMHTQTEKMMLLR